MYFYFLFTLIVLLPYLRSPYHLSSHNSGSGLKTLQLTYVKTPNIGDHFISPLGDSAQSKITVVRKQEMQVKHFLIIIQIFLTSTEDNIY